jgi:hypothetical protein
MEKIAIFNIKVALVTIKMCFFDKNALPILPIQRQYHFEFVRAHFRTRYLL